MATHEDDKQGHMSRSFLGHSLLVINGLVGLLRGKTRISKGSAQCISPTATQYQYPYSISGIYDLMYYTWYMTALVSMTHQENETWSPLQMIAIYVHVEYAHIWFCLSLWLTDKIAQNQFSADSPKKCLSVRNNIVFNLYFYYFMCPPWDKSKNKKIWWSESVFIHY